MSRDDFQSAQFDFESAKCTWVALESDTPGLYQSLLHRWKAVCVTKGKVTAPSLSLDVLVWKTDTKNPSCCLSAAGSVRMSGLEMENE